ncbi:DUF1329 domain-containing protein, partial [Pseudomonas aeruginosa]|nr:DUF1329 domain-containing protein [Pseudomonas aeruginosa]
MCFLCQPCGSATAAKIPLYQAARLDQALTPLGAERAGNADGSIPPWTGGITQAAAASRPRLHHPGPVRPRRP